MKWFIILVATLPNGHEVNTDRLSGFRFPSHAACMAEAGNRAGAYASVGLSGRYLCMYHGEPDRELAASRKGQF